MGIASTLSFEQANGYVVQSQCFYSTQLRHPVSGHGLLRFDWHLEAGAEPQRLAHFLDKLKQNEYVPKIYATQTVKSYFNCRSVTSVRSFMEEVSHFPKKGVVDEEQVSHLIGFLLNAVSTLSKDINGYLALSKDMLFINRQNSLRVWVSNNLAEPAQLCRAASYKAQVLSVFKLVREVSACGLVTCAHHSSFVRSFGKELEQERVLEKVQQFRGELRVQFRQSSLESSLRAPISPISNWEARLKEKHR